MCLVVPPHIRDPLGASDAGPARGQLPARHTAWPTTFRSMRWNGLPRCPPGVWRAARAQDLTQQRTGLAAASYPHRRDFPAAGCPPCQHPLGPLPCGPRRPLPSDHFSPSCSRDERITGGVDEKQPYHQALAIFGLPPARAGLLSPPRGARTSRHRRKFLRGRIHAVDAPRRSWADPAHIRPGNGLGSSVPPSLL
jgi:hypothetical protein